jgi:hypothetical protein
MATPDTTLSIVTTIGSIQITRDGTLIPENLSYAEWFKQVQGLRMVKHLYHAALSDLVKYGRKAYGESAVDDAMRQLHFDLSDVYRANALVALESGLKLKADLSQELRYVIGKELADNPEKQEEWANIAVAEKLSPAELRMSIQTNKVVHGLRSERSPGIVSFESVSMSFQRAVRQYGGTEHIRQMDAEDRAKIVKLLEPVTRFIAAIT